MIRKQKCLLMQLMALMMIAVMLSANGAQATANDAPIPALGKAADFVAPDWMLKDRPEVAKAIVGAKVYRDIEYVPGASKLPLTDPAAIDPEALAYLKAGGKTRAFDIYFPAKMSAKMPLVVFFHGGPNRGTKEGWCPALVLLTQGYVVVSANYRLRGETKFPATLYDCKAVIRWMRAHADEYHIDPDHIGAWGHSAGAWLVAWLGTTNDEPSMEGDEGNLNFSSRVQAAVVWSGGAMPIDGDKPTPLKFIDAKKSSPYLLMHGDKDPVVPIQCEEILAQGLTKAGVECSFIPVPGAGHGIGGPALEKQVIAFFDRHLKPGSDSGIIETKDLAR